MRLSCAPLIAASLATNIAHAAPDESLYRGTIGKSLIVLRFYKNDKQAIGRYFYRSQGVDIGLVPTGNAGEFIECPLSGGGDEPTACASRQVSGPSRSHLDRRPGRDGKVRGRSPPCRSGWSARAPPATRAFTDRRQPNAVMTACGWKGRPRFPRTRERRPIAPSPGDSSPKSEVAHPLRS